jgi:phenylalanyl-tRNA synthetase beta chain
MKVTLNWLQDYIDLSGLSAEKLADGLTMAGLEVEALTAIGQELSTLKVGQILDIHKHPKADRLSVCRITLGTETIELVCGAGNIRVGDRVPVALPETRLPSGLEIQSTTIRQVASAGMLCSEQELGLSDDHSGIMILPPETELGLSLSRALDLEDMLLEINVTPNRADCLSHIGIAREISAIFNRPLKFPDGSAAPLGESIREMTSVTLEAPQLCPRYTVRIIEGVTIAPSPLWLRRRLNAVGIRSINNVVDVTNFILMELGQPLHGFDFDTLGEKRIVVRTAQEGEKMTTLDGQERNLTPDMLVIADGVKGVALAGIMGGQETEIQPSTGNILLESAFFDPSGIRRTAKRLSISTEASIRFERGIDIEGVVPALNRAALMIQNLAGGRIVSGLIDQYPKPLDIPPIIFNTRKAERLLGIPVSVDMVLDISRRLGLSASFEGNDRVEVIPTSFRRDLTRPVDLMEEVARLTGYDHIPATIPNVASDSHKEPEALEIRRTIRETLTGLGLGEIITYSFIAEKQNSLFSGAVSGDSGSALPPQMVRLGNPISDEQSVMRLSLIPGLLMTMNKNWSQRNLNLRLFEVGKVFLPREGADTLPLENNRLTLLWTGRRHPEAHYFKADKSDFYDLKGAVEILFENLGLKEYTFEGGAAPRHFHPEHYAKIYGQGKLLGELGEISTLIREEFDLKEPGVLCDLDLDLISPQLRRLPMFQPWPRFPEITRDMALIIDETVLWKSIREEIISAEESLIEEVELFDLYQGKPIPEGKKNMGVRIHFRSTERTLSDEEVNEIHERLLQKVLNKFGGTLREK